MYPIVPLEGDKAPENGYDTSTVFVGEGAFQRPINIKGNHTNLHSLARSRIVNFFALPSELSAILADFTLNIAISGLVTSGAMLLAMAAPLYGMSLAALIGVLFIASWAQVIDLKGMKAVFLLRLMLAALGILVVI